MRSRSLAHAAERNRLRAASDQALIFCHKLFFFFSSPFLKRGVGWICDNVESACGFTESI